MALSDLIVNIAGNSQGAKKAFGEVEGGLRGLQATSGGVAAAMKGAFVGVAGALAPLVAAFAGFAAIKGAIGLAAEFETAETAMGTLLGDAEQAKSLMKEIETFSAQTPFALTELADATRILLSFGRNSKAAMKELRQLSDVAAATGKPLADFANIMGKTSKSGVQLGDINQLAERGVPIYEELAKIMHVAESEIRKLASTGQIGFTQLRAAIAASVSEGGRLAGGAERASKTLAGKWSTFKDNFAAIMRDVGFAIIDAFDIKGIMDDGTTFLQKWRDEMLPPIKEALQGMGSVWKDDIVPAIKTVADNLPAIVKGFADLAGWTAKFAGSLATAVGFLGDLASEGLDGIKDLLGNLERRFGDPIKNALKDLTGQEVEFKFSQAGFKVQGQGFAAALQKGIDGLDTKKLDALKDDIIPPAVPDPEPLKLDPVKREDFRPNRSLEVGTREAFETIFAATRGGDDAKKPEKEIAKHAGNIAKSSVKVEGLLEESLQIWRDALKKFPVEVELAP